MNPPFRIFINRFSNIAHNLLFGAGLAFTIENEKYHHIPLVLFFPGVYAGYQAWKKISESYLTKNDSY
jgi:hypothetical protein